MSISCAEAAALAKYIDGPTLVGIFLNVMLYGVMVTQTFFYFSNYPADARWVKCYVAILFFADTLNTIFNIAFIYNVLVNNFGNATSVTVANWLFETEESMVGIIAMQAQIFYIWRIHKLTGLRWLVCILIVTSVVGCLGGIASSIVVAFRPIFTQFGRYKEAVIVWLGAAAITDIMITSTLVWYLRKKRSAFPRTNTIVSRIIQLTVSNGLLTASFAVADVIAFVCQAGGLHLAFNYPLCKLYGNSVMASLNSRAILIHSSDNVVVSTFRAAPRNSQDPKNVSPSQAAQVTVNVEVHQMTDISEQTSKQDWPETRSIDMKNGNAV
ncbi:uncharacterized protein LAESUDRAFT_760004 [Laetiporus sulphureus 93-53]|uniref:DUF6534 domain-containing protein n=1 Tax=Laetiporus sulphureus 93-53 TaxID=1314785 RepID=A0A165DWG8_9APHY|nr:uncharacterized protein LAESUDRAFT_760004 [Laetiporus sulphureus 93-53]KZT05772.1 hypothetical protein LAESUDRAFT_760004 [Laetiporus sulphureus 93-53]